jgi:hypothetical protein
MVLLATVGAVWLSRYEPLEPGSAFAAGPSVERFEPGNGFVEPHWVLQYSDSVLMTVMDPQRSQPTVEWMHGSRRNRSNTDPWRPPGQ